MIVIRWLDHYFLFHYIFWGRSSFQLNGGATGNAIEGIIDETIENFVATDAGGNQVLYRLMIWHFAAWTSNIPIHIKCEKL